MDVIAVDARLPVLIEEPEPPHAQQCHEHFGDELPSAVQNVPDGEHGVEGR